MQAFPLIRALAQILPHSFMHSYNSPSDMVINTAGSAITNDRVVCLASLQEIQRKKEWYTNLVESSKKQAPSYMACVQKCDALAKNAKAYCEKMGYKVKV